MVGWSAQEPLDELVHRVRVEALKVEMGAVADERAETRARRRLQFVVAVGPDEEDPGLLRCSCDEIEQRQGGIVGPLEVIEHQHERPLRGQDVEEPGHGIEQQEAVPVGGLAMRGIAERGDEAGQHCCIVASELAGLFGPDRSHQSVEDLHPRPVPRGTVHVDAGAPAGLRSVFRRGGCDRLDKGCLADTCLPTNQHCHAMTVKSPPEQVVEAVERLPAADEFLNGGSRGHGPIFPFGHDLVAWRSARRNLPRWTRRLAPMVSNDGTSEEASE
jgi:hypothetical protein